MPTGSSPGKSNFHMAASDRVFLLYGNDEFAIAKRLNVFQAEFDDPSSAEMNTARLEARLMSEDELNNAVNAMPFLAPRRLVQLSGPSARYTTPAARKKFEAFLRDVPETARLVIVEVLEARDEKKHWLVKWGRENGIRLERFMMPRAWEMAGWIVNQTKEQGGAIDPKAAARLSEMVGEDTRQAAQEITKLLTYVDFARPVSLEDVEAVSLVTAQQSVFDFVDALALGNGQRAQFLLRRLLEDEDPFSLWGMVIRQFRLLILAREVIDAGGDQKAAEKALGVHSYVAEKAYKQARGFELPALEQIYRHLLVIDEEVKTGQFTMDLALEVLVVELGGGN
jgi:DNA polymerase-3 subunit delta